MTARLHCQTIHGQTEEEHLEAFNIKLQNLETVPNIDSLAPALSTFALVIVLSTGVPRPQENTHPPRIP